ncbi:MAG: hypothetical protein NZT61_01600 [Deltaproteobacteria bacterium]|nr:hypothetical protein [Deltaproteobacteria bacterium]
MATCSFFGVNSEGNHAIIKAFNFLPTEQTFIRDLRERYDIEASLLKQFENDYQEHEGT